PFLTRPMHSPRTALVAPRRVRGRDRAAVGPDGRRAARFAATCSTTPRTAARANRPQVVHADGAPGLTAPDQPPPPPPHPPPPPPPLPPPPPARGTAAPPPPADLVPVSRGPHARRSPPAEPASAAVPNRATARAASVAAPDFNPACRVRSRAITRSPLRVS